MKNKRILWFLATVFCLITTNVSANSISYDTIRDIDKWTFNEYRYNIVKEYLSLKNYFQVNSNNWGTLINSSVLNNISALASEWYKYLPNNLTNENLLNNFVIALKKWKDSPNSEVVYNDIVEAIDSFLEKVVIYKITWNVIATPQSWNAPLVVSLRANNVVDSSKNIIPNNNYIWWVMESWSTKRILWRGPSITTTFNNDWIHTVTLDVISASKNSYWKTDVLPFSSSVQINVKEKIANVVMIANDYKIENGSEIKFTPEEWAYWIIFDATSSTPTGWAKFTRTEWDFWNWVTKKYNWSPKIERAIYAKEWSYNITLKLKTNEWNTIEQNYTLVVHNPIAVITANKESWYIWEAFQFSAKTVLKNKNLVYSWKISSLNWNKDLIKTTGTTFNYTFKEKWKFVLKLETKDAAWNTDTDIKTIEINSRAPVAEFSTAFKDTSKPNRIFLDASRSTDLDTTDIWKLQFKWKIDWKDINLENPLNPQWSIWYYTFNTVGQHSISLEVVDPDSMNSVKTTNVDITSLLSVDFTAIPRVVRLWSPVRFKSLSDKALFFEWDFADWEKDIWKNWVTEHIYKKSWKYSVSLKVSNQAWNTNTVTKIVYVVDANSPKAIIDLDLGNGEKAQYFPNECSWNGAYVVDRTKTITFKWINSVNVDWTNTNLLYSWKIWNKLISSQDLVKKFDEIWCFPVKLTVTSASTQAIDTEETYIKVENLKPTLTSLQVNVLNTETDPVIVDVTAVWAKDPDWAIVNYLWYYYTDDDKESQDFRITNGELNNTTKFVLPKLPGSYTFVVVMTDTNNERISSEEVLTTTTPLQLDWDNINTPIIDFEVNKNNVVLWEEIIFTNKVKNILWQDITKEAEYSFDFDGDGFYDLESKEPNTTYKYTKWWIYRAKVKVKHKWMTNVRNVEINVENVLTPSLDYISIWSKFIFFNTTTGQYDKASIDTWNWYVDLENDTTTVDFSSWVTPSQVSLRVTDWTKIQDTTKDLVVNNNNFISSLKSTGLKAYTFPEAIDDTVTLKNVDDKFFVYLWDTKNAVEYAIDEDISIDSDLNWAKDDDIDNLSDKSHSTWEPYKVKLNENKTQTVRLFVLDAQKSVIWSKDIKLVKEYITTWDNLKLDVDFTWVTDDEKVKIEQLKNYIQGFPEQYKLQWLKYLNQLKEEWASPSERTKVIIAFWGYITENKAEITNASEIQKLLESLILGWEAGNIKEMAYNVISNLIPKELKEKNPTIQQNLDLIKANPSDVEWNKILAKEILEAIKDTDLISTQDKLTIRAQIQVLIYWDVSNIPQEVKEEVQKDSGIWMNFSKILKNTFIFLFVIVWLISGILLLLFIYFKSTNTNFNQWFQDFLIELFDWSRKIKKTKDILDSEEDFSLNLEDKSENKSEKKEINEEKKVEESIEEESQDESSSQESTTIPSWLSGAAQAVSTNSEDLETEIKQEESFEENNIQQEEKNFQEEVTNEVDNTQWEEILANNENTFDTETVTDLNDSDYIEWIENIDSIEDGNNQTEEKIPDWLKWSFSENNNELSEEVNQENNELSEEDTDNSYIESTDDNFWVNMDDVMSLDEVKDELFSQETLWKNYKEDNVEDEFSLNTESEYLSNDETLISQDEDNTQEFTSENKSNDEVKEELFSNSIIETSPDLEEIKKTKKTTSKSKKTDTKKTEVKNNDLPDWLLSDTNTSKNEDSNWLWNDNSQKNEQTDSWLDDLNENKSNNDLLWDSNNDNNQNLEDKNDDNNKKDDTKKPEVLWNDWMDVPDWLKN